MSTEDQNRSKSSSSRVINSLLGGERDKGAKGPLTKKKPSETRITSADANKTAIAGARPDAPSKGASQLTQLKNLLVGVKGKMQDKKKPTASPGSNNLGSNQSLSRPRTSQLQGSSSMTKMNSTGESSRISQKSMDRRLVKPTRTEKSKSITVKRDDLNTSQNGNSTNSKRSSKPSLLTSVFKKTTPSPGSQGLKLMSSKSSARVTQSSARSQSRGTSNLSAIKHLGLGKDSRSYLNGGEHSEHKEPSVTPKSSSPVYHEQAKRRTGEINKTRTDEADTETSSQAPHPDQSNNLHKAQRQHHDLDHESHDHQPTHNAGISTTQQAKKPVEAHTSKLNSFVTQVRPGQMFSDMSSKQVDLDKEIERALTPRISDRHVHEPTAIAMNGHIVMPSSHPVMHLSNGDLNDDKWKQYYRKELIESLKSSDDQNPRVKAFREHLFQSAQSVLFLQNVERIDDNLLIEKKIYMPPNLQSSLTRVTKKRKP